MQGHFFSRWGHLSLSNVWCGRSAWHVLSLPPRICGEVCKVYLGRLLNPASVCTGEVSLWDLQFIRKGPRRVLCEYKLLRGRDTSLGLCICHAPGSSHCAAGKDLICNYLLLGLEIDFQVTWSPSEGETAMGGLTLEALKAGDSVSRGLGDIRYFHTASCRQVESASCRSRNSSGLK